MKGIDVSYCQQNINWGAVEVDFAIIRGGYGKYISQKDKYFERNYDGCKKNNIPVGVYWYSYAMNEKDAIEEAKVCLEVLKGKQFEMPIYFDLEEQKQFALGKAKVSAIIKAFLSTVEAAGYWVGLYMSAYHLGAYVSEEIRKRYAVWVAHWTTKDLPSYTGQFGLWQYGIGNTTGVTGDVDVDRCYVDYPKLIKAKGLNGFATAKVEATKTTIEPITIDKGDKIVLKNEPLYVSSTSTKAANNVNGTYYVYDGKVVKGRRRITTSSDNVGKTPISKYVTGWITSKTS